MKRKDSNSQNGIVFIKIMLCLILFVVILASGIFVVDSSFGSLLGEEAETGMLSIGTGQDGSYHMEFLGKNFDLGTESIPSIQKNIKNNINYWGKKIWNGIEQLLKESIMF